MDSRETRHKCVIQQETWTDASMTGVEVKRKLESMKKGLNMKNF